MKGGQTQAHRDTKVEFRWKGKDVTQDYLGSPKVNLSASKKKKKRKRERKKEVHLVEK